jgi:hypothetical protein
MGSRLATFRLRIWGSGVRISPGAPVFCTFRGITTGLPTATAKRKTPAGLGGAWLGFLIAETQTHLVTINVTIDQRIRFPSSDCHSVMLLASKSAPALADPAYPRWSWQRRPRGSPLWRIARTDLFPTWAHSSTPASRYQHALHASSRLVKIAHLGRPK